MMLIHCVVVLFLATVTGITAGEFFNCNIDVSVIPVYIANIQAPLEKGVAADNNNSNTLYT